MSEMLSAASSLISTNRPERTFSTSFWGKGCVAGERLKPEAEVWGPVEVFDGSDWDPSPAVVSGDNTPVFLKTAILGISGTDVRADGEGRRPSGVVGEGPMPGRGQVSRTDDQLVPGVTRVPVVCKLIDHA